jgi:hypothetical protein
MELLAIWQRGFYQDCFALSEMGIEGAGGGEVYRRAGVLEGVWSGSDGAGDTRQKVRWRGMVLLVVMVVGALQKGGVGRWWCAWRRARVRGARVSGGVNDPDVCGL